MEPIFSMTLVALTLAALAYGFWATRERALSVQQLKDVAQKIKSQEFENAVLRVIEDEAGDQFDVARIAHAIADAIVGVVPRCGVALAIVLPDKRLHFKAILSEPVSLSVLEGMKQHMRASLALCNGVADYQGYLHDEIIGVTIDEDEDKDIGSYFIIPLLIQNVTIGVLAITCPSGASFELESAEDIYASVFRVTRAASRIAVALTYDRNAEEARTKEYERRAYQAEVLRELNERVGYSLDLAKIIEIITGNVGKLLDYDVIAHLTRANEKIILRFNISRQVSHAFVADTRDKMLNAYGAIMGIAIRPEDIDESITGSIFDDLAETSVQSFFNLPIAIGGKIAGMITVASSKSGIYTEEETAILYTITAQASNAVNKLNEVLEQEKGKLNALVATLDDGIFMVDTHWDILVVNAKARSLLKLPEGDITTFDVLDKLSSKIDIRTRVEKMYTEKVTPEPTEIFLDNVTLQVVILPVSGRGGDNLGAVVVFHDITKERQERNMIEQEVIKRTAELRQEQSKLRASIDSLNIGFFMTDLAQEVIMMNPVARDMLLPRLDASQESAPQEKIETTQGHVPTMSEIESRINSTFNFRNSILRSLKEKAVVEAKEVELNQRIVRVLISPISGGEHTDIQIGSVVLVEDITERRIAERSKDEFFSIASHELRTPLTAIRGNVTMINQYYKEVLKDDQLKEMLKDIEEASVRMIDVVNDFFIASELEQGRVQFKREVIDVHKVLEDIAEEFKEVVAQKALFFEITQKEAVSLKAFADKEKVRDVLRNLVENALQFTEHGGITVDIALRSPILLALTISDTGRGIAKENQALLFKKLQQAGSSILTRDTAKGTGLGLYNSQLYAEGMGGTLALDTSTENEGSRFVLTLPRAIESTGE